MTIPSDYPSQIRALLDAAGCWEWRSEENNSLVHRIFHPTSWKADEAGPTADRFYILDNEFLVADVMDVSPGAVALMAESPRLAHAYLDIVGERDRLAAEVERLLTERTRLLSWLGKIEGGDNPCDNEFQLRHWAWKAGMGQEVEDE